MSEEKVIEKVAAEVSSSTIATSALNGGDGIGNLQPENSAKPAAAVLYRGDSTMTEEEEDDEDAMFCALEKEKEKEDAEEAAHPHPTPHDISSAPTLLRAALKSGEVKDEDSSDEKETKPAALKVDKSLSDVDREEKKSDDDTPLSPKLPSESRVSASSIGSKHVVEFGCNSAA
jgi:hypothetical protein